MVPGAFIIYPKSKYDLNNTAIKEEVLDAANNIYLAWNPNFDSIDADGYVTDKDIIWIDARNISTTTTTSKSEMFNFGGIKNNRMLIDKVLTDEEVMRAKSRK